MQNPLVTGPLIRGQSLFTGEAIPPRPNRIRFRPMSYFEGIAIVDGVVVYRTPPLIDRNVAYAWAADAAERRGYLTADIKTAARR